MSGRSRRAYLAAAVLVLALALGVQAVLGGALGALAGDDGVSAAADESGGDGPTPGNTLISSQSYRNKGKLLEVSPDGEVVWEYAPEDSRIFDAEVLDNGDILVAVATRLPAEECPARELDVEPGTCVYNRIERLDYGSKEVVWEYTWYDEYITHHEVHDMDMLETGEIAVVDMGNDRAFTVDRAGNITWEWSADERIAPGTDFYQEYGGDPNPGGEADWTHINDIDQLENGNFQLSVRNFDSVIEVNPETKAVVAVYGQPGNYSLLYEQHNPNRLADGETILVADSENQRIIEVGPDGRIGWEFGGPGELTWPRDADRLPNGTTLVTDSVNDRVIEVAPNGTIVWEYQGVALPYSADRVGVPEESGGPVVGNATESRFDDAPILGTIGRYVSFTKFILPAWVGTMEVANAILLVVCGLALVVETVRRRYRSV